VVCRWDAQTRAATSEAVKPLGEGDKAISASMRCSHPRLVQIDAADARFADLRGEWETVEHLVGDKALIDTAESIGKSLEYGF
jgi:hypothetical protein